MQGVVKLTWGHSLLLNPDQFDNCPISFWPFIVQYCPLVLHIKYFQLDPILDMDSHNDQNFSENATEIINHQVEDFEEFDASDLLNVCAYAIMSVSKY